jgi:hypothetical protein
MNVYVALGVPEHFVPKAQYAIRVLLAPYEIKIVWCDVGDVSTHGGLYYGVTPYPDQLGNKPVVCIESLPHTWDYFASRVPYDPSDATHTEFMRSSPVPILFGSHIVDQSQIGMIWVHADLVASAFFWLSDWQDVTRPERDTHGRQPFQGSMQQILQLHSRAAVDEYSDMLVALLREVIPLNRRKLGWSTIFSHDIDRVRKKTAGIVVRESLDYLMLNRLHQDLKQRLARWFKSMDQFARGDDAYETSIMRILNEHSSRDIHACFLFKSMLNRHIHDANDYLGYPFFDVLLASVHASKAEIGYHSGYLAGSNADQLRAEYGKLCNRVGQKVLVHRSHYLRYAEGITFPLLEELGIKIDSSVAWAEQTGFRAQTCRPYPLFDIATNRQLQVLEIPLSVMDTQPFGYMKLDIEDAIDDAKSIVNTVIRHGGVMVWNFHHHIYDELDAPGWYQLLEVAFDMGNSGQFTTFHSIYEENAHTYD